MARVLAFLVAASLPLTGAAQQQRFEDVIRNLRNPDPKARLAAVRMLREARYPEAIAPMAPLVGDPVDEIQLEAIGAELAFFVDQDIRTKRMIGFVIEKRNAAVAAGAFELGPLAVWPRPVPPSLVSSLLSAVDDENARVRLEAIYAAGVVARPPLQPDQVPMLLKALDHYDPSIRVAAARVIGRLNVADAGDALMKAVTDSQPDVRYAAMHALGDLHDARATAALTEQLAFYKKGEGGWAALDALARIASPSSVPAFRARLADKDPYYRRAAMEGVGRAGDAASIEALERAATTDDSAMARTAAAFALQKLGRTNYTSRIVDAMSNGSLVRQAEDYLVELGPTVASTLVPRLQDPEPDVRAAVADVLGAVGGPAVLQALQAATADRSAPVASAAKRAIERIKATPAS
jgi:HEAT repeat protein